MKRETKQRQNIPFFLWEEGDFWLCPITQAGVTAHHAPSASQERVSQDDYRSSELPIGRRQRGVELRNRVNGLRRTVIGVPCTAKTPRHIANGPLAIASGFKKCFEAPVKCNRPSAHCQRCPVHCHRPVGHCHELQKMFWGPRRNATSPPRTAKGPASAVNGRLDMATDSPKKVLRLWRNAIDPPRTAEGAPYTATWLLDIASGFKTNVFGSVIIVLPVPLAISKRSSIKPRKSDVPMIQSRVSPSRPEPAYSTVLQSQGLIRTMRRLLPALFCVALFGFQAHAHPGHPGPHGLAEGLAHPLGGLDHIIAMLAVGLWAGQLGGRAIGGMSLTFAGGMFLGAVLHWIGVVLPLVQAGSGCPGLCLAFWWRPRRVGHGGRASRWWAASHCFTDTRTRRRLSLDRRCSPTARVCSRPRCCFS